MSDVTPARRMSRTDRRLALLDAAGRLLRQREPTPLSFEAIAAEAGVSATLPYKYFDSVDEVADELYRRLVGAVDDATDQILADPERPFDTKVHDTISRWCDTIREDGLLLLRLADDVAHPSLRRAIDRRRERAVDVWAAEIEAEFALEPTTARLLAASMTASSTALLRRWIRDRLDRDTVIDLFVTMTRGQIEAVERA